MAAFNKFNIFVADVANGKHNLGSDSLKILLTNTAPTSSNAVKADITEISAGNGYSAGGVAVTGITSSQTSGTYKLVSSATLLFLPLVRLVRSVTRCSITTPRLPPPSL
jgi:hypothetical protein